MLKYEFELTRHTGKNKSLKKGNQVLNANDRMHYIVKSQITEYLRQLSKSRVGIINDVFSKDNPMFNELNPCNVSIIIESPTRRRTDAPNFYPTVKALIDGMTDAGVWSDDNNEIIKSFTFKSGGLNKNKKYKFTIIIEETEKGDN